MALEDILDLDPLDPSYSDKIMQMQAFIETYICADIEIEDDVILTDLVRKCQVHRHSARCGGKKGKCSFAFPRPISTCTRMSSTYETRKKARFYQIKRKDGSEFVCDFNKNILRAWGANMDLSFIGSKWRCAMYVTEYDMKDSNGTFEEDFTAAVDNCSFQDKDKRSAMFSVAMKINNHRRVSMQEAAYKF